VRPGRRTRSYLQELARAAWSDGVLTEKAERRRVIGRLVGHAAGSTITETVYRNASL
jgi:hypothetical protein